MAPAYRREAVLAETSNEASGWIVSVQKRWSSGHSCDPSIRTRSHDERFSHFLSTLVVRKGHFATLAGAEKLRAMDTAWFKKRMKMLGISQDAIAGRLARERTAVVRILAGKQPMRLDDALVFAELLKVSYREVVERALSLPAGGLNFGSDEAGVPLRYKIAALESDMGAFDLGESCPRISPPPKWNPSPGAFAAEVMDDSFNRRYRRGSVLYCIPPNELNRPLHVGDACVFLHLSNGVAFEARGGIVTPSTESSSFLLAGASLDPKNNLTIWFDRESAASALSEGPSRFHGDTAAADFLYEPRASDNAIIVGVVTAAFRPDV